MTRGYDTRKFKIQVSCLVNLVTPQFQMKFQPYEIRNSRNSKKRNTRHHDIATDVKHKNKKKKLKTFQNKIKNIKILRKLLL